MGSTVENGIFRAAVTAGKRKEELQQEFRSLAQAVGTASSTTGSQENQATTLYGETSSVRAAERFLIEAPDFLGESILEKYNSTVQTINSEKSHSQALMRLEVLERLISKASDPNISLGDFMQGIEAYKKYELGKPSMQTPFEKELAEILNTLSITVKARELATGELITGHTGHKLNINNAYRYLDSNKSDIISGTTKNIKEAIVDAAKEEIAKLRAETVKYQEANADSSGKSIGEYIKYGVYGSLGKDAVVAALDTRSDLISETNSPTNLKNKQEEVDKTKEKLKDKATINKSEVRREYVQAKNELKKLKTKAKWYKIPFKKQFWGNLRFLSWTAKGFGRLVPGLGTIMLLNDLRCLIRDTHKGATGEGEGTFLNSGWNLITNGQGLKKFANDLLSGLF